MKKTKRLLMILLSLVLVLTLAPMTAFALYADAEVDESIVKDITELVENKEYKVSNNNNVGEPKGTKWFKFTPDETNTYCFYSEGTEDTYVAQYLLVDGKFVLKDTDDDNDDTYNFCLISNLEAGTTYYFCVSTYSSSPETSSFTVRMEKKKAISEISINGTVQGFSELKWTPGVEIKITYTDGTEKYKAIYPDVYSSGSEEEVCVNSYYDFYGNKIELYMPQKDIESYKGNSAGSYPMQLVVKDEEGNKSIVCDITLDIRSIEGYFDNAPTLKVGDIICADSKYHKLYVDKPYILEIEEEDDYTIANLTDRGVYSGASLYIIYKSESGTYSTKYIDVGYYLNLKKGTYYAVFDTNNNNYKYVFGIKKYSAYVPAKSVSVPKTMTLEQSAIKNIGANLIPATANDSISYFSSNTSVATIDSRGNITAIAPGSSTITVTAGKIVAKCVVTVNKPQTPTTPAVVKPGKVTKLVVKNSRKNTVSVKFNKAKNAKKYVIRYSTDKNFKKGVKTKTITKNSCLIKKLKKGKTYYFKVRAINGTAKGSYTRAKRVKIKK